MSQLTKEEGIDKSAEKQESVEPGWMESAVYWLVAYAAEKPTFITEDFRKWAEEKGLSKPAEPRAYGAVIRMGVKAKAIAPTGQYRPMTSSQSHSCPKMVWKSLIF